MNRKGFFKTGLTALAAATSLMVEGKKDQNLKVQNKLDFSIYL